MQCSTLELPATRQRGWFYQDHSYVDSPEFRGFQDKEGVMSVPVLRDGALLAILSSRVIRRAVREDWLATVLAPRLKLAAASIAAAMAPAGTVAARPMKAAAALRRGR